ncbi:mRNA surveillance protein pelota [Candidatus Woesearchaeota archaeon]|nr:mRNA surveillance protein pelota [Candidatus Woesearchaeota archaeon]
MKIIFQDLKKGEVKVEVHNLDDLWYLSHIIEEGDQISGKSIRKIKLGEEDANTKIIKKVVFITIAVEKIEFEKYSNGLRVSGKICEAPEDVPHGSYHSFELEEGSSITIRKKDWAQYQIQTLREACEEKTGDILILVMDRAEGTFALLSRSGYSILTELEGEVGKKGYGDVEGKDFYGELAKQIDAYALRFKVESIIVGSPAFWKEELLAVFKKRNPLLAKHVTLATCNTTGKNGIEEVLKRDEVKTVLKKDRTTRESVLVEELFKEISTQGHAVYGRDEVLEAGDAHAIKVLLITDSYLQEQRREQSYTVIDQLMKEVDRAKGAVQIISSEHEAGKRLQGIGGIAAILRYKLK